MKSLILIAFVLGCGASPTAQPPLDDAGNPIVDAAGPQNLVDVPLDCVDYTREVRHAATDGSRDVTINSIATVNLAPGADFVLSICDAPIAPTCNSGDVCTGSLEPSAAQTCIAERGSGVFYDGKLTIRCGTRTERYSSSGTLQSSTQTTFTARLEIFQ